MIVGVIKHTLFVECIHNLCTKFKKGGGRSIWTLEEKTI